MATPGTIVRKGLPIVYHSLEQVLKAFKTSEVCHRSEVSQLLTIGINNGILDHSGQPILRRMSVIKPKLPFIVIEGLDGSGKSKLSEYLADKLELDLLRTPPPRIHHLKEFFDQQIEPIRRAFYSFGNYLAAQTVSRSKFDHGIVMDRYFHSTAAYALAHELSSHASPGETTMADYNWPDDLLKPNVVLFLVVSEEVRRQRHAFRNTTNTPEEQKLASNGIFRQNLIDSYLQIKGVSLIQFDANEDIEIVKSKGLDKILELFPILNERNRSKKSENSGANL